MNDKSQPHNFYATYTHTFCHHRLAYKPPNLQKNRKIDTQTHIVNEHSRLVDIAEFLLNVYLLLVFIPQFMYLRLIYNSKQSSKRIERSKKKENRETITASMN